MKTFLTLLLATCLVTSAKSPEPVAPTKTIELFQAKDLSGFTTWLEGIGGKDEKGVFSIKDGVLRVSGAGRGYVGPKQAYKDYHLTVEYKWGRKTDDGNYVRNSGLLIHATGPEGNSGDKWMASVECQLAQGCEGDLIVIRGTDFDGKTIPVTVTSDTLKARDNRTRWNPGGKPTKWYGRQFWWALHDPDFKELIDTRGRWDIASPLGEWTNVEVICVGARIAIKVNGVTVNEVYEVFPAGGRILFQNEGHEIFFRNAILQPVKK